MARKKTTLPPANITREQAEDRFAEFAAADAKLRKLQAEMDAKITKIREQYSDKLAELEQTKEAAFVHLQAFADQNPEYFVKRKSIEMTHGLLGYRTGTPKLKTLKGITWGAALNLVKEVLGKDYVRVKEEVDKERILAERNQDTVAANLHKCGIEVAQDETFFVEAKTEAAVAA